MLAFSSGPLFVLLAAFLWALDALIRTPLTQTISPVTIVFWEHVVGLFVLSPFSVGTFRKLPFLKKNQIFLFCLLALVSSIGGTVLFTKALSLGFATGDFVTPLLLQKLQPVLVTILALVFLKEKLTRSFWLWAPLALAGGYMMSFGTTIPQTFSGKEQTALLALGATFCWGAGTIISKKILTSFSMYESTWFRFFFTVLFLIPFVFWGNKLSFPSLDAWIRFFAIALTTGSVALLLYYRGLKSTPAHIATFAELIFPLTSILIGITSLNPYGAPQILSAAQLVGILLLLISVTKISLSLRKNIVSGVVVKGAGDGKKLGYPTANLQLSHPLSLRYGVYAGNIFFETRIYNGIIHYGPRKVFGETHPLFEVHIFDFDKQIYGKTLSIEINKFIRPTKNFSHVNELVKQIEEDCKIAKNILHQK